MEKQRVVITGMGAITPLGLNLAETWAAVQANQCGIGPITLYDTSAQKVTLAGEVKNFDPEQLLDKREARKMDRFVQFALASAIEAMENSGLNLEGKDTSRCGVVFANYDGKTKRRSAVEDNCFIGCNCNIVAPVHIGEGAYIAAGTTVTKDVASKELCIGRAEQRGKAGGAAGRYKNG